MIYYILIELNMFKCVSFVDEPDLASIMTYDYAEDLCASELSPLGIEAI